MATAMVATRTRSLLAGRVAAQMRWRTARSEHIQAKKQKERREDGTGSRRAGVHRHRNALNMKSSSAADAHERER